MALRFGGPPRGQTGVDLSGVARAMDVYRAKVEEQKIKNLDKDIGNYFTSGSMYEGGLNVLGGELSYDSTSKLPSFNDAWQQYKAIHKKYGKEAGMAAYGQFKQIYNDMSQMYGNQLSADIRKYTAAGYSAGDIKDALTANPNFLANANTLIGDPVNGAQYAAALAPYMPKKSIWERMGDAPGTVGLGVATAGAAGVGATRWLAGKPDLEDAQDILDKAKAQADDLVQDTKESAKYKKATRGQKAKMTREANLKAKDIRAKAQAKFDATPTRGGKLMKSIGKAPMAAKVGAYAALPLMIEGAMASITGEEDMGSAAGQLAAASMTGAQAIQSGAALRPAFSTIASQIKKHGLPKILRKVMKEGGVGLAARTLAKGGAGTIGGALTGGALTALMAAWSMKDIYDISQIIADM